MPKVKKKTPGKKKAATRRSSGASGVVAFMQDRLGRFATIAAAGVTSVALIGAIILWTGGYVGLLGERINRLAGGAAAASGFEVRRVTVRGLEQTAEDELLSAIGPVVGASLLHFDPHAARARVEQLGWVRAAAVSRLLPNTIHVSVREREPAAVWQLSGALHLIDQNGAVIREIGAYEYSNLPLIVGAGAPEAASDILTALRGEAALWGAASALIRVGDRRWNLRLTSGADVKFPEYGVERAVSDLAKLQAAYGILDRPLEYIDLRNPDRLVYREKDAPESSITP
ncbi:MAG: cell division protein FtsQ/DivIB [Hyphococcus sp.]